MHEREFPPDEQSERIAKQIVDGVKAAGWYDPDDIGPDVLGGIGMDYISMNRWIAIGVRNGYDTVSLNEHGLRSCSCTPEEAIAIVCKWMAAVTNRKDNAPPAAPCNR